MVLAGLCLTLTACGDDTPAPDPGTLLPPSAAVAATVTPETALGELGCGACHPGAPGAEVRSEAPPLAGAAYDRGYLLAYLLDPRRVRTDIGATRMPDFHLDEREALALTLHLGAEEEAPPEPALDAELRERLAEAWEAVRERNPEVTAEQGAAIYRALNCAGCHAGSRWTPGPPLADVGDRRPAAWLREYLAAPHALRPFGFVPGTGSRMPDFRLTPEELDAVMAALTPRADTVRAAGPGSAREAPDGDAPPSAFSLETAETLLRDRLSCLGCHRYEGEGGRIGPALDGVATRLVGGRVDDMVRNAPAVVPGTIMPRTLATHRVPPVVGLLESGEPAGEATEGERRGYLSLVDLAPLAPPALVDGEGEGATLYRRYCASCHGITGEGDGYNARWLPVRPTVHADPAAMSRRPDDVLFDAIHAGGHIMGRSPRMPAFGGTLSAAEIRALVDHIRALCECRGPAWSRDGRAGGAGG